MTSREFDSNPLPPDQRLYVRARELLTRQWEDGRTFVQITFTEFESEDWRHNYAGDLVDVGQDESGHWFDVRLWRHIRQLRPTHPDDPLISLTDDLNEKFGNRDHETLGPAERAEWSALFKDAFEMRIDFLRLTGGREELPVSGEVTRRYYEQLGMFPTVSLKDIPDA